MDMFVLVYYKPYYKLILKNILHRNLAFKITIYFDELINYPACLAGN